MKTSRSNVLFSILVLLPSIVLVGVFVYGFIGNTLYVSMTDWGRGAALALEPDMNFVGLENYQRLFTGAIHQRFRQDLVNAFFYTIFLIGGTIGVGFFLAMLLDMRPRAEGFFRALFLYPMALSFVVTGTIWRWLLAPRGGVNIIPTWFGLPRFEFGWLSSRQQVLTFNWQNVPVILAVILAVGFAVAAYVTWRAKGRRWPLWSGIAILALLYALVIDRFVPPILAREETYGFNLATIGVSIAAVWQYSGYTMALYAAGLRGIPETLRESAMIDGAGSLTYYMKIALPSVWPITLSAMIVLAHVALKLFALIFTMAGADNAPPGHPAVLMYLVTFRGNQFAIGAGIAVMLFLLTSLFVIPYVIKSHKERQ